MNVEDRLWESPKEYLSQAMLIDDRIKCNLNMMSELRSSLFNSPGKFKEDRIQTSLKYDFTDTIDKIVDLDNSINKDIDSLIEMKSKILSEINAIDSEINKIILKERYISGKSLIEISSEYNYEYSYVRKCHGWALEEFKKIYKEYFIK